MLKERLTEFFKDLGYILKKFFTSRILPFALVSLALFSVLAYRVFNLQIVNGEDYSVSYTLKAEKTVTTKGTRGNIYDCNGKLLAYSELAYSVVIEDCGYYETNKIRHAALNAIIARTVEIIEDNGDKIIYDFGIDYDPAAGYYYTLSDNALLRFLRDVYGHSAVSELTDEERGATAADTAAYLRARYQIMTPKDLEEKKLADKEASAKNPNKTVDTDYSEIVTYGDAEAVKIAYIRYNLAANSYKRYISFTVANNINKHTMTSILENGDILTGVSIKEDSVRKYNYGSYIAHIVGYTGKISSEQLEEFQKTDPTYDANDTVGKAGIELAYEDVLSGTKGETTMLVDSVGRVLEITEEKEAQAGQDVYLTIDVELTQRVYDLLEKNLSETLESYMSPYPISDEIVITPDEICFALINNNLIDTARIASSDTEAAAATQSVFSEYRQNAYAMLEEDLRGGIPYGQHNEQMQEYLTLARKCLIDSKILDADKISLSDELHKDWKAGKLTFREYLDGAVAKQWVNIFNLDLPSEYSTSQEVLDCLINETMRLMNGNGDFDKLIYEYLIENNLVSQRNICLILMEQGKVKYTEDEYANIYNGGSVYDFLKRKIHNRDITPAQLALDPCSGSCVLENPNTGEILALVTYPSYDINYFSGSIDSEYYQKLLNDKSTPLVNRATSTKIAPGSTFKPLMAVAGLAEGAVSASEEIDCDGIFDRITPNIKCHVYPREHGGLDTINALINSCNEYFCEIGYRLCITPDGTLNYNYGLERIKRYTELLGLSTKTGIQISETVPHPSDFNAVASSIGQGTNAYTSLNLARYISTIANSGTVYDSTIVSRTSNSDGSDVKIVEPSVASRLELDASIWNTVHEGMRRVITDGIMYTLTDSLPATVYGKSGTAQEDKTRADHACYVMFTTDENNNPEMVSTVMIPYSYAASHAGIMAYYALAAYYGTEVPESVYFDENTGITVNRSRH
ncbi:MAG: penicillin-binding transpeptidase domain-containing protein [Butyrivibrio sp.]|nr:penicillin-binding transpeptidase domain-containing protein [Butyrivibrio sp.]